MVSFSPIIQERPFGERLTLEKGGCRVRSRQLKDLCALAEDMIIMVDVQQPRGTFGVFKAVSETYLVIMYSSSTSIQLSLVNDGSLITPFGRTCRVTPHRKQYRKPNLPQEQFGTQLLVSV